MRIRLDVNGTTNNLLKFGRPRVQRIPGSYQEVEYILDSTGTKATLTSDLIPCYRKTDNVVGTYDTSSETFSIQSGYTAGPWRKWQVR